MCTRGFTGCFDFFHLPLDFSTKKNRGYAFVNFLSAEIALRFRAEFGNTTLPRHSQAHKIVEICAADIQGFHANVHHYLKLQSRRVADPSFRPVILRQVEGTLVSYPLCANHMPKKVWKEITRFPIGTQVSRLGLKDAPDHILSS